MTNTEVRVAKDWARATAAVRFGDGVTMSLVFCKLKTQSEEVYQFPLETTSSFAVAWGVQTREVVGGIGGVDKHVSYKQD